MVELVTTLYFTQAAATAGQVMDESLTLPPDDEDARVA
jgi:hypothetical protein